MRPPPISMSSGMRCITSLPMAGTVGPAGAFRATFVELPSQILENWAGEPELLKEYALHYETGEPIPDELIEKLTKAEHFNQGFLNVEYLAAAILDMDWHTAEIMEMRST
jgi:Zn-dependent oligopeptidase